MSTRGFRVSSDPGPGSVFGKMAKVLGEVSRMAKTGTNRNFGYKFVTESDLTDELRPRLAEHGLAVFVSIDDVVEAENARVFVHGTVTFADDTGAWVSGSVIGEARDVDGRGNRQDKGVNKAITAMVKYFLLKTFLVSTGDDPEHDQNNPQETGPPPGPPPTPMMTDAQEQLIRSLAKSSKLTEEEQAATTAWLDGGSITRDKASQMIDRLTEKTK